MVLKGSRTGTEVEHLGLTFMQTSNDLVTLRMERNTAHRLHFFLVTLKRCQQLAHMSRPHLIKTNIA